MALRFSRLAVRAANQSEMPHAPFICHGTNDRRILRFRCSAFPDWRLPSGAVCKFDQAAIKIKSQRSDSSIHLAAIYEKKMAGQDLAVKLVRASSSNSALATLTRFRHFNLMRTLKLGMVLGLPKYCKQSLESRVQNRVRVPHVTIPVVTCSGQHELSESGIPIFGLALSGPRELS